MNCGPNNRFTVSNVLVHNCGYQGAAGAILRMWPKHLPIPSNEEAAEIAYRWRNANKNIVQYWRDLENACLNAVTNRIRTTVRNVAFFVYRGILFCELPNKRLIAYPRPRIGVNAWDKPCVICHGISPTTKQWLEIGLYGGLITENIIQGLCRDVLFDKMIILDDMGLDIRGHVHDEVIIQCKEKNLDQLNAVMNSPIDWLPQLPVSAVTKGLKYYKKA